MLIVPVLEGPPVRLRVGVHDPVEMFTEIAGGTEAAVLGHKLDRQVARLEETRSEMDALTLKPLVWSSTG
jgi:hypothetical protein